MDAVQTAQSWVLLALGVGALALEVFALVDALRHRADAYVAAGKRTKTFWTVLLGVCGAVGFVTLQGALGFLPLLAVVGAGVYLADVRPALRSVSGRGGRGTHMGPYGPW